MQIVRSHKNEYKDFVYTLMTFKSVFYKSVQRYYEM